MYAAKAFAIRKVIRKILVEQGFGFTNDIEGETVDNLESWMLDVSHSIQNIVDTHKDLEGKVAVMKVMARSPQTSSETSESPQTSQSPEC